MKNIKKYKNIPERFVERCHLSSNLGKPAFRFKKDGFWIEMLHNELLEKVTCMALGLLELGIRHGDRIGIVSENRIEWIISSLAINCIGAVDVPLFPILTSKQIEDIFGDCSATAVIVSNNYQLSKILEFKDRLTSLRQIILMSEEEQPRDVFVHNLNNIIARGCELRTSNERMNLIQEQIEKIKPDDLITLIYTSGTTGNPKGVMLSHGNILSNIDGSMALLPDLSNHESLMYLPLCHSYERIAGFYTLFFFGTLISLAESIESVPANVSEIKPSLITTVPKMLETMKKKVYISIDKESKITKTMFNWAVSIGEKKSRLDSEKKSNPIVNAQYKIAEKIVLSKIRAKLGGRMKLFVSGGAPMSPQVGNFFQAIGITVLQGYGLTEASPVVSLNSYENNEIGTIGLPLPNIEVKIAADGEILVKGPNVMKGYWNDQAATNAAIDPEDWLYTGDIGEFTSKGNLKITDRKKNLFVSSGGKNIAPQPIENLICHSRYIDNCVLIGDNREYITALITPNFEQLESLAKGFGIEYANVTELISNDKIITHIKQDIDFYQKDLSKFERIRRFQLLSEPFTVNGGELSPKMSVKRHIVERKYSDLIETMYK
ncbi:MAG: long-chain fatty acid--CoA ligase [Candidatus Kapabacteria bacterium]|nr:long-chain fatty acid--CoA ligase [Ignavibacteriota bacterium]MCW5884598.1 long-chain fatty acid--CoA ligase [Candidatus Kapabacteria bacterium]